MHYPEVIHFLLAMTRHDADREFVLWRIVIQMNHFVGMPHNAMHQKYMT